MRMETKSKIVEVWESLDKKTKTKVIAAGAFGVIGFAVGAFNGEVIGGLIALGIGAALAYVFVKPSL